jgi:hypothetical protein
LVVYAFDSYDDADQYSTYITNFKDVRLERDAMAFVIVFAAPGTRPGLPPSAADLPELGAADSATGQPTTTAVPGDSVPPDSAVDSSTTIPQSAAPTTTLG